MPKTPKMLYVLVRDADVRKFRIMYGHFDNVPKVGEMVERDRMLCGSKYWSIVKVYDAEQQRTLESLSNFIGIEAVQKLIDFDYLQQ